MQEKKLTAEELHALYAPLWEKVPETRPSSFDGICMWHLGWSGRFAHPWQWCLGAVPDDSPQMKDASLDLPEEIAAALCRVAVEDWLMEHLWDMTVMGGDLGSECSISYDKPEPHADGGVRYGDSVEVSGPTIHHALVAAAMAVAGEKAGRV